MVKKLLALIRQRLNVTTATREVTLLECRAPRNKENRNEDGPRRNALVDTSTINALLNTSQGSSSSSSLDSEVHTCSKDCLKSYEILQKQYDQQREDLNKSNLEIISYQMGLESLEARIIVHEKNKAVYEEDIAFLKESDVDDSLVNDRFKTSEGFHAVPSYTWELHTSKDIVENPKIVRPSVPIIEDWDTDSDNDSVFRPKSDQTKPKFIKINFVKSDENVKSDNKETTHRQVEYPRKSQSPRDNRRNWNGLMTQKLGNGFEPIKKACFVCGSFNHLIKYCDFHDKKMVEKPVLNNKGRVTGQREIRPVWNNAQRVKHRNKFLVCA
ncbi:hypothetical protein Tco_0882471 [Tanacetum coccineum]